MAVKATIHDAVQGAQVETGQIASADPASIAAGAVGDVVLTVTGAATTDQVFVTARAIDDGLVPVSATVSAANTITIKVLNTTAGAIDATALTFDYVLVKVAA